MVWAILFVLGIPLWFIVVGITVTVVRNRKLRARKGNMAVRVRRPGKTRWTRGHSIWVSDVFSFRGSPAAWSEDLVQVASASVRDPSEEERHKLRHIGDRVQIAVLATVDGETYEVAAAADQRSALLGPLTSDSQATTSAR